MEKEQGLLKKIIKGYNDSQILLIKKIIDNSSYITDENGFLDDGYIRIKINRLKKEHNNISQELTNLASLDVNSSEKSSDLLKKQQNIEFQMAFLASNSDKNIEMCLGLLSSIQTDFKKCLYALKDYKEGEERLALGHFIEYFYKKEGLLEHYLINKVFGTLLFNEKEYTKAAILLRKAVEKRPEDVDLHRILYRIYHETGQTFEEKLELQIIELLE